MGARAYKSAIFSEKLRIAWFIIATTSCVIFGFLSFNVSGVFGVIGNAVCLSLMAYAVIRYRLISLNLVINDGLVKVSVGLSLITLYLAIAYWIEEGFLGETGRIILHAFLLLLMMEVYPKLIPLLKRLSDRYFVKVGYDFDAAANKTLRSLKNIRIAADLKPILDEVFYDLIGVEEYSLHLGSRFVGDESVANDYDEHHCYVFDPVADVQAPLIHSQIDYTGFVSAFGSAREAIFYEEIFSDLKQEFARFAASAAIPLVLVNNSGLPEIAGVVLLGKPLQHFALIMVYIQPLQRSSSILQG